MRMLEHGLSEVRGALRRVRARAGVTDPAHVQPARLVIRLDDRELPGVLGAGDPLSLSDWRRLITSAVDWLGPLPVTVLADHRADHPGLAEIVRFAHRLECHTTLVTDGSGVDRARAEELVDRGLAAARILVGGVSDAVHRAVVGNPVVEACGAVEALLAAKQDRGAPLDVEVAIPWRGPADAEVRAVFGWARQVGADGVRLVAPWRARDLPADPELLDALAAELLPFHRTAAATLAELHAMVAGQDGEPGMRRDAAGFRRRRFRCPVGGLRVEVTETGHVFSCPFKPESGVVGEDLRDTWASAGAHLGAIAGCDRACAHVELAPAKVFPGA